MRWNGNGFQLSTAVLKQAESRVPIGDLCRQVRILEQSFYRWQKLYGNTKLKRLVADLSLDRVTLQDVVKKVVKRVKDREIVGYLMGRYEVHGLDPVL